jgi:hypothetical protein
MYIADNVCDGKQADRLAPEQKWASIMANDFMPSLENNHLFGRTKDIKNTE